jgi:hypothetical protein
MSHKTGKDSPEISQNNETLILFVTVLDEATVLCIQKNKTILWYSELI